jgi:uncharacterized coiled-coil DUF342 family protein
VATLNGLEKFSHLEDKIYRAIEMYQKVVQQRDQLQQEVDRLKQEMGSLTQEKDRVNDQLETLILERDEIRAKVEGMLEAIAIIDPELAEPAHQ